MPRADDDSLSKTHEKGRVRVAPPQRAGKSQSGRSGGGAPIRTGEDHIRASEELSERLLKQADKKVVKIE